MLSKYSEKKLYCFLFFSMKKGGKAFRESNYFDLIRRNLNNPKRLAKIKKKVQTTLAIVASCLGYSNAAEFCELADLPIINDSTYYSYLHFLDSVLDNLAGRICSEKLEAALHLEKLIAAFDAGWAHRRNADQCIGVLIDLLTGLIISFHIVQHDSHVSPNCSSTDKSSQSMEKIALQNIIEKTNISESGRIKFVHDCDIKADNIVKKYWPDSEIVYDPNHFIKSKYSIIDSYCNENSELKKLNEKIKKFYRDLMHDQEINLEEKVKKWREMVNHYKETQNWSEEENSETIQTLKEMIEELSGTFSKIDPKLTTNCCESFNHSRALLASKDIAWRLTWRIRAFISIIRWNEEDWVKKIFNEFLLFDIDDTIAMKKRKARINQRLIEKTECWKKNRANYRSEKKKRFTTKPNDKNDHMYKGEEKKKCNRNKIPKLSRIHKLILMAIDTNHTEDKPFVSTSKIIKYIHNRCDYNGDLISIRTIKAQLTRMENNEYIIKKKNSYSLLTSNGMVNLLLNNKKK